MNGLYIFAGIIIFFWLLLSVSTSIRVIYNSADIESLRVYAKIGFFKINIIPLKPKKVKKKRFRRKKVKKIVKKKFEEKQEEEKYSIFEIAKISKDLGLILLKKTRKYLKIKVYKINIKVGAEDAYKTAKLYANINQAAYYIYEILKNNFKFKAGNINISSDFLSEKIDFDIDIKAGLKIGAGLNMLVAMALNLVKLWAKNENNIKNNVKKESGNKWRTAT
jgi:hypothetical protein